MLTYENDLGKGLTIALANQSIYPVFCCSATRNMGSGRIMGFINDIAPSPADRPDAILEDGGTLKCDSNGEPAVFIYKTMSEPRVGTVSYFKVYSGKLSGGTELHNSRTRNGERFGQLYEVNGKSRDAVDGLSAGDIASEAAGRAKAYKELAGTLRGEAQLKQFLLREDYTILELLREYKYKPLELKHLLYFISFGNIIDSFHRIILKDQLISFSLVSTLKEYVRIKKPQNKSIKVDLPEPELP